jgi:PEP-CTERM motif
LIGSAGLIQGCTVLGQQFGGNPVPSCLRKEGLAMQKFPSWIKSMWARRVLVGGVLLLFAGGVASADTTYTYAGQPLTDTGLACGVPCLVKGSFTLPTALGPNLSGVSITPSSFSFTDGFSGWTSSPAPAQFVNTLVQFSDIDTDAAGNLTSWTIGIVTQQINCEPNNCVTLGLQIFNDPDGSNVGDTVGASAGGKSAGSAGNSSPGCWSIGNAPCGAATTPEPSTVLLLCTGLIGAAGALRRKLLG